MGCEFIELSEGKTKSRSLRYVTRYAKRRRARKSRATPVGVTGACLGGNGQARVLITPQKRRHAAALQKLFDGDGLGEVARLIYIAAAADGDVVGEKLERNNFEKRREELRRGRKRNNVACSRTG